MRGESIRDRLHKGERVYGTNVCSLGNPLVASWEAELPFDFIFVCNEHMPIDRSETSMICQLYAAKGISPIVRIHRPDPFLAAMALDGGAQGIVAPYVETVEEVAALVGAVKYRPIKGQFMRDILDKKRLPSQKTIDFLNRFNRDNYVIIGIESVTAYERLDDLLAVPGVDGVFMGAHDLSVSLEQPEEWDSIELKLLMLDVIRRCRAAGVGVGVHIPPTVFSQDYINELLDAGMNWVLYGADIVTVMQHLPAELERLRKRMGDTFTLEDANTGTAGTCLGT